MYNHHDGAPTIPFTAVDNATFLFANISEQHSRACTAPLTAAETILYDAGEQFTGDYMVNLLEKKVPRRRSMTMDDATILKSVTAFCPGDFEALCGKVCPHFATKARSTREKRVMMGRPPKMDVRESVLLSIFYMGKTLRCTMKVPTSTTVDMP